MSRTFATLVFSIRNSLITGLDLMHVWAMNEFSNVSVGQIQGAPRVWSHVRPAVVRPPGGLW